MSAAATMVNTSAFTESPILALAQEILIMVVFAVSFLLWRKLQKVERKRPQSAPTKAHAPSSNANASPNKDVLPAWTAVHTLRASKASPDRPLRLSQSNGHEAVHPHIRAAELQMLKLLSSREFTRALNMFRSLERDGKNQFLSDETLFLEFVQSAIRVGKLDVVERMMRTMHNNGVPPSINFWQTTMKMLSTRKHFAICLSIYTLYGDQVPADKVTYSCLINAALELGEAERAVPMLIPYKEAGLEPKDYVLCLRTYVANSLLEPAEALFAELGDNMSPLMFNLVLLICVNLKQAERGWKHILAAHELEVSSTEKIVDVVSYNTIMKGFAKEGAPQRCMDCYNELRKHGLEPDDITYSTLLDMCIIGSESIATSQVVNLLIGSESKLDTVMCTTFIKGLVRAQCLPKAVQIYEGMKQHASATPDIVTYSVLIKAFIDTHELETALKLLADMKEFGLKADDIILTHLLEGCRHCGNHELGKQLFHTMLEDGVKPSEFTLITMVKLLGQCGAHEEAYHLVDTFEESHQVKPSVIHYTCLMSGCIRSKNYAQAWKAYILMCKKEVALDEMVASTLLPGMVAAHEWDKVLAVARQCLEGPVKVAVAAETLNNALSQLNNAGGSFRVHFQKLRVLMENAKIPIFARNSRAQ